MVVTETGPQSRMFSVGPFTGQVCSLQWAENTARVIPENAAVLCALVRVDYSNSPVNTVEPIRQCILALLTVLQEEASPTLPDV